MVRSAVGHAPRSAQDAKRSKKEANEQLCARCATPKGRIRGPCVDCTRTAVLLDADRRCRPCREAAQHVCDVCATNGPLTQGRCHRCVLADEFDSILGDTSSEWLVRLRSSVLAAANPTTTMKWLHDSAAGRLLLALARGVHPLSHETLDQHSGRGIDHLRGLLVSVGGLGPDNGWMDRLEQDLREITNAIVDPIDRAVASGWVRWHGLARLRRRVEHGDSIVHSGWNLRTQTRQIVRFIAELHAHERSVSTCTQTDIDSWFARPVTNTMHVRVFLNWATKHAHLPKRLTVPPSRTAMPSARDSNRRWKVARRLVNDETINNSDRVLGVLAVLYAQPLTRVVQLTTTDVRTDDNGVVTVTLGPVVIELPEPFAGLAVQLPERRHSGMNDHIPTAWLFPGNTADRHTTVSTLSARGASTSHLARCAALHLGSSPRRFRRRSSRAPSGSPLRRQHVGQPSPAATGPATRATQRQIAPAARSDPAL